MWGSGFREPLPEPAEWGAGNSGSAGIDPADRVTLDESVTMAFLVVLDTMTPAERVAFVLHDVYRYPFTEVAEIACRQLASAARRRIRTAQPPTAGPSAEQAAIVRDFKAAWAAQDIDALINLLDPGATATADGGGLASTHVHPIVGGKQIAHAYAELAAVVAGRTTFVECTVNGLPGLAARQEGRTVSVFAFEVAGERIRHIWVVANPAKIRPWQVRGEDQA